MDVYRSTVNLNTGNNFPTLELDKRVCILSNKQYKINTQTPSTALKV